MLIRILFTWREDGSFDDKSVMELAGEKVVLSATFLLDRDGYRKTIEGASREGKFHLEHTAIEKASKFMPTIEWARIEEI